MDNIRRSDSKQELSALYKENKDDLAFKIVRRILSDIQGRYGLDRIILGGPDRKDQEILVSMFEEWRHLVSHELYVKGLISESYTPMEIHELGKLSLYQLLEIRENYLRFEGED
ncbi:hypothetical protein [Paenibacillus sp. R14(2021)]|uniref:hypothetical protein n=1 Tax=Paenibacillus sp. R14(2021) TaxID=2859228 RepID=UPI001C615506|nr:hypothetical protein [Paenibacillus sp. R14(2021)]